MQPRKAKPSQAKPSQAKPSQAKRNQRSDKRNASCGLRHAAGRHCRCAGGAAVACQCTAHAQHLGGTGRVEVVRVVEVHHRALREARERRVPVPAGCGVLRRREDRAPAYPRHLQACPREPPWMDGHANPGLGPGVGLRRSAQGKPRHHGNHRVCCGTDAAVRARASERCVVSFGAGCGVLVETSLILCARCGRSGNAGAPYILRSW